MRAAMKISVGSLRVNGVQLLDNYEKKIEITPTRIALVGCAAKKFFGAQPAKDKRFEALLEEEPAFRDRWASAVTMVERMLEVRE